MNRFELEKAKQGAETLSVFFNQFGTPDEHSIVVLNYIFELLYNIKEETHEKNLHLSCETE